MPWKTQFYGCTNNNNQLSKISNTYSTIPRMPDPYSNAWLDDDQYRLVCELFPRIPGLLSILGSTGILLHIANSQRNLRAGQKLPRPSYHRMLALLSSVDIVTSLAWTVVGRLAVPVGPHGGFGTVATCTCQGFLATVGIMMTLLYNAALMIQFVATIRYGVTDRTLVRRYEPVLHSIALLFPLTLGLLGLFWQIYHPIEVEVGDVDTNWTYQNYQAWLAGNITHEEIGAVTGFCFINSYPPNCRSGADPAAWNNVTESGSNSSVAISDSSNAGQFKSGTQTGAVQFSQVPCTKGENSETFAHIFLLPYLFLLFVIMACVVIILVTVCNRERSSLRFGQNFQSSTSRPDSNTQDASASTRDTSSRVESNHPGTERGQTLTIYDRLATVCSAFPRISILPDESMKMTRLVGVQSILYGFIFINTFVWMLAWAVSPQYWNIIVFESFVSLQGEWYPVRFVLLARSSKRLLNLLNPCPTHPPQAFSTT